MARKGLYHQWLEPDNLERYEVGQGMEIQTR